MTERTVRARVDAQTKAAFHAVVVNQGTSESRLLQLLIGALLKNNSDNGSPSIPPTEIKDDRFSFRLSAKLKDDLARRAKEQGASPGSYLVALARTHLSKKPYFTERELEVLRQSNSELTAIGRNINQIARALNRSLDHADMTRSKELEQVAVLVKGHRDYVRGLIRANLSSWGIEREEEKY